MVEEKKRAEPMKAKLKILKAQTGTISRATGHLRKEGRRGRKEEM